MQLDIKTLSAYRLDRAKEDLQAAVCNHQAGVLSAKFSERKPFAF